MRRYSELMGLGLYFIGCGISGGEIGARYGPSMMPGGSSDAWDHIKPLFQCISAKVDNVPCCDFVGGGGSGHYVKMVHNGIEYGDMQVIAEVYAILKDVAGLSNDELSKTFEEWNKSELDSYLIEITANIFKFRDPDGKHLIDKIRDAAGQKGTGKWSGIDALNDGVPLTLIVESVFARCLSSLKNERVKASAILVGPPTKKFTGDVKELIECTRQALYAAKIISYTQGFMTMRAASDNYKWDLNMGAIASMWRGGCIIRSTFLGNIKNAFDNKPKLQNLLFDDFFKTAIVNAQEGWRKTVVIATQFGIPIPCLSSALSFYDGYRSKWVPANLTQAQRDYFGSHTYELLSNPGNFVHTNWTGYDQ
ncbi:hypothetical protein A3Q56_03146 [Intoshia linei]|uniref:6-phosphogluconate dehydrogenase, decarboxylating n=1 Tax=Intoshia linei TaxID=1819745 RepID=A0A177B4B1_9BILA|nr:hypothetical protein A3Q56_03146 [Intoshia linei]